MKEFWEKCHEEGNIRYLSNYSLEQITDYLGIEGYIREGSRVLDIGVGTGRETKEMVEAGMEVYGLDITMEAYWEIMDYIEDFWLFEDIEQLPEDMFDLAVCQLVVQHITDDDLRKLLKFVIKSLRIHGILAIQFGSPMIDNYRKTESEEQQREGEILRTKTEMAEIVRECDGTVIFECETVVYEDYEITWNGFHVRWAISD